MRVQFFFLPYFLPKISSTGIISVSAFFFFLFKGILSSSRSPQRNPITQIYQPSGTGWQNICQKFSLLLLAFSQATPLQDLLKNLKKDQFFPFQIHISLSSSLQPQSKVAFRLSIPTNLASLQLRSPCLFTYTLSWLCYV